MYMVVSASIFIHQTMKIKLFCNSLGAAKHLGYICNHSGDLLLVLRMRFNLVTLSSLMCILPILFDIAALKNFNRISILQLCVTWSVAVVEVLIQCAAVTRFSTSRLATPAVQSSRKAMKSW